MALCTRKRQTRENNKHVIKQHLVLVALVVAEAHIFWFPSSRNSDCLKLGRRRCQALGEPNPFLPPSHLSPSSPPAHTSLGNLQPHPTFFPMVSLDPYRPGHFPPSHRPSGVRHGSESSIHSSVTHSSLPISRATSSFRTGSR